MSSDEELKTSDGQVCNAESADEGSCSTAVTEADHGVQSNSAAILSEYEVLFKDRFTDKDADYASALAKGNITPPCVENFFTRPKRDFDHSRNQSHQYNRKRPYDGGGGGGHGGWGGRGGGGGGGGGRWHEGSSHNDYRRTGSDNYGGSNRYGHSRYGSSNPGQSSGYHGYT